MDVEPKARKTAKRLGCQASGKALAAGGGRSVDVEARGRHDHTSKKGLISSDFPKPSDGLEPSTPSLPFLGR